MTSVEWKRIGKLEDLPEQGEAVLVCGWGYSVTGERERVVNVGWVNKEEEPEEPVVSEDVEEIEWWAEMPEVPEF